MLLFLAGPMVARERHLHWLYLPLLRGKYVISKLCLFFLLLIHGAFLLLTPHAYSFISLLIFFWQSKYKEDTSATRPILLDELELEVHSFLSHAFSLPRVAMCFLVPPPPLFCIFIYFFYLNICLSFFFLLIFSFRLIPSPFLFITPRVGKFLML